MMKKMGKGGMLKKAMGMMGKGGGAPDPSQMDPAAMQAAAKQLGNMPGQNPFGGGGLPGGGMLPPGLSGFGKKK
jgi:signal recognition particle subunit SRP54